jgi:parallel beta-helix repeat protein
LKLLIIVTIIVTVIFGASLIPSSNATMMDNPQCDHSKVICISNQGWECNEIGKWNQNSKTCTLMKNITGKFIDIVDSGITLDGNGYKISGKFSEELLKENGDPRIRIIDVKASNVEIKNISVKGFPPHPGCEIYNTKICSNGIVTNFADLVVKNSNFFNHYHGLAVVPLPETWPERNCIIENNTFSNSKTGASTFGCTIKNNEFANNGMGFWTQGLGDNVFFGNYFYQNYKALDSRDEEVFQNTFEDNGRDVIIHKNNLKLYHNNFINNIQYYAHGNQNYYDFFDTKEEGCIASPKNNFCPSLGKDDFWTGESISYTYIDGREFSITPVVRVFDSNPWRIQDGWLYEIIVPADMEVKTDSSDGKTISYHVTGSGPDGIMPVTCNYASGSTFPIGTTEVICSLENGFVSSFLVTIVRGGGGGCLIATATYGSELAPQVQQLRELRDNQLLQTESGTAFIGMFNNIYYSFSPTIADMEREHPMFKEAVKVAITPMISTLSIMENAESESEVLGIGISVIMLNLGMYLGIPAVVVIGIRKRF